MSNKNKCSKCGGLLYIVTEKNFYYKNCINCGFLEFPEKNNDKTEQKNYSFLCEICNKNKYIEDLNLSISICGYCYFNYLYNDIRYLIDVTDNINLDDKEIDSLILFLKAFKNLRNINFESYLYYLFNANHKKPVFIGDVSKKTGIPRIILKDILLAKLNIETGYV